MPQVTPSGDRMVIRGHLVLAVPVALDHRNGLWLDYQIVSEAVDLLGGLLGRVLVVVTDGNQICHVTLLSLARLRVGVDPAAAAGSPSVVT
jgi:hypothetical protein